MGGGEDLTDDEGAFEGFAALIAGAGLTGGILAGAAFAGRGDGMAGARVGLLVGFVTLALLALVLFALTLCFAGAGFLDAFLATFAARSFQAWTDSGDGVSNGTRRR